MTTHHFDNTVGRGDDGIRQTDATRLFAHECSARNLLCFHGPAACRSGSGSGKDGSVSAMVRKMCQYINTCFLFKNSFSACHGRKMFFIRFISAPPCYYFLSYIFCCSFSPFYFHSCFSFLFSFLSTPAQATASSDPDGRQYSFLWR